MKKTLNKPQRGHADAGLEVGSGLNRELRYLYSLAELNLLIAQGMAGEELGWLVVTAIPSLLEVPFAALALDEAEDGNWQVIGQYDKRPLDAATAQEVTSLMADGLANKAQSLIGCLLLSDLPEASGTVPEPLTKLGLKSALVVAVRTTRNKFGVLMVGSEVAENYNSTQRFLIGTLASQIAVSLENASLLNQAQESEERYMRLFEGISDAVMVYGSQGIFLDCNEATLQRLGYSRDEFLRLEPADIVHPDFHLKMKDNLERILAGESTVVESAHRCKDGRFIPVEAHACRIEYGGQPAILAVVRDITERKRAEEALRESEQKLRLMFDSITDGIVVSDLEGNVVEANRVALRTLGYHRKKEFIGRNAFEFVAEKDRARAIDDVGKRLEKIRSTGLAEYRMLTTGGRELDVELSAAPLHDSSGNLSGFIGVVRDITERKQVEEALRESEAKYRDLIENISDIIYAVDENGMITYVSPAVESALGYSPSELVGQSFADSMYHEDLPRATEGFLGVLSGNTTAGEYRLLTKSGEMRWMRTSNQPIFEGDRVTGARGVLADITERKQVEEALRESEEKLRRIFESVNDGIVVTDLNGVVIDVNEKALQLGEFSSKNDIVGKSAFEAIAYHDREKAVANMQELLKEGVVGTAEHTLIKVDGSHFPTEISASVMKDAAGNPVGFISVIRDITERKQVEEALRESEEKYRKLVEDSIDGISIAEGSEMVFVNQSLLEMFGFESEYEMVGHEVNEFVSPGSGKLIVQRTLARQRGEDVPSRYEIKALRKDGTAFDAELSVSKIDYQGRVAVQGIVRDITERKQVEEALRASEEKYRRLLDDINDGYVVLQGENTVFANSRCAEICGYSLEEIVGKPPVKFLAPGAMEKALEVAQRSMSGESIPKQYESVIVRKDGTKVPVEFSLKDVIYEGKPGVSAVVRDITERKQAEEALRASEEKLRIMFESIEDGIAVIDLEGNIAELNEAALRISGYSHKGELIGRSLFEFILPKDLVTVRGVMDKIVEEGWRRSEIEYTVLPSDGRELEVEISSALLRNSSGNPVGIIAVVRDITERKRVEEELIRLSNAVRMSNDSIVISDLEANIIEVNEATMRMYSTEDKGDLVGKNSLELIAPEDQEKAVAGIQEALQKGYYENVEYHIITKDGGRILVEMSSAIMKGADGKPTGFVAVSRDITERKRAQEEIAHAARREEALCSVAQAVSRTLDLGKLLNEALTRVLEVMDTDVGGIYLLDLQAGASILKAHTGVSEETVASIGLIKMDEEEIKRRLEWQETVLEPDRMFNEANVARIAAVIENEGVLAHVIVPFWSKGVPLGALVIADRRERQFSAEDIDLLRAIGNEIAVGIENTKLLERTRELSVIDVLTGLYNRRHFYEMLDTEVHRSQRYDRSFSLVMLDIDGFKEYNDRFGHTNGDAVLQSLAQNLKSALRKSDTAFRYGGDEFTIILPATDADRAKQIIDRINSKWLQTPKVQYPTLESPLGFSAGIAQFPENAETADGLVFLADTALYHAKKEGEYSAIMVSELGTLSPDIRSTATLDQVYALAATVDAKDPYTYGHSARVATIAETIGKAIGLSEKGLADLYVAALLHDIGKVGVPDSILTKPGSLIEDEWRIVKMHSAEGARIFSYVRELRASVPMILHHHEWYGGMGYPSGLKGEEIPLGARIISIADAYDTMTTPRPYRDVISHEEACEELRRCSMTQFDPELVEAFCRATTEADRQD